MNKTFIIQYKNGINNRRIRHRCWIWFFKEASHLFSSVLHRVWLDFNSPFFFFFFWRVSKSLSWCSPEAVRSESFSNLRMARLFRGGPNGPAEDKRKVFYLLWDAAVGKRSMSSGFPPRVCLTPVIYRSRTIVAGLCENIKPVQDRISTTSHESTPASVPEFRLMLWKTFLPLPPWISPIRGLLHRRRLPEQRCFSRATSDESIRGSSIRLKYILDVGSIRVSSSLFSREEMLKFDRIPTLVWRQSSRSLRICRNLGDVRPVQNRRLLK